MSKKEIFYIWSSSRIGTCDFASYKILDDLSELIKEIQNFCESFCIQYIDCVDIYKIDQKNIYKFKIKKIFFDSINHDDEYGCCANNRKIKMLGNKYFIFRQISDFNIIDFLLDAISFDDYGDGIGGDINKICEKILEKKILSDTFIDFIVNGDVTNIYSDTLSKTYQLFSIALENKSFYNNFIRAKTNN